MPAHSVTKPPLLSSLCITLCSSRMDTVGTNLTIVGVKMFRRGSSKKYFLVLFRTWWVINLPSIQTEANQRLGSLIEN